MQLSPLLALLARCPVVYPCGARYGVVTVQVAAAAGIIGGTVQYPWQ